MRYASASRVANAIRQENPLSDDQLFDVCPSIFATEPYRDRSERYSFVSTIDLINWLKDEFNLLPYAAMQSRTRLEDKKGFAPTLIELRRPTDQHLPERFSFNLVTDHAGQRSVTGIGGINVKLCANGCVMGGDNISMVRVRHSGNAKDDFIEGSYTVLNTGVQAMERIDEMKSIQLSGPEQLAFARSALALRWDGDEKPVQPEKVLTRRRWEERGNNSLWQTFNSVQENLIRGGVSGRTTTNRRMTTRAVSGVNESVRLNQALWQLAEAMTQLKAEAA